MNLYGVIILGALLFEYVLEILADILNLRSATDEVPGEFAEICNTREYRKSQQYLRAKTRYGWIVSTFDLCVLLLFWFVGGFRALDRVLRGFDLGPVSTGLLFITILVLAKVLLDLPFHWYSTFVIEERFGFNKTTHRTFLTDLIKSLLLGLALGVPLLAAVLAFFEFSGNTAWLYCWGLTTLFAIVMQFIAPVWIMPLFNKFTPLEEGPLRTALLTYAEKVGFPAPRLFVIDGSRRSNHSNAFVAGFGKHKRITLFDTLVARHSVPELVAVVAHEVGHWRKKHVIQGLALGIAHAGLMFYLLSIFLTRQGLFETFGLSSPSVYAGLVFFGLLYTPAEMVLSVLMNRFSRRNEYAADRFAAQTTGRAHPMIEALRKLAVHNLSNLTPHRLTVWLSYSHPPVLERIRALQTTPESLAKPAPDTEQISPKQT